MALSAAEALASLVEGNHRFVNGTGIGSHPERRADLVEGQQPFAAVLGCADSRVPVEAVFDQGLGDLFVVRVAGNVAGPSQVGSLEFAVSQLGVRLIVVLGHSACGAVDATLAQLDGSAPALTPGLGALVSLLRPGVESVHAAGAADRQALSRAAVRANVAHVVRTLGESSVALASAMREEGLEIVGAEYALDSGEVVFL